MICDDTTLGAVQVILKELYALKRIDPSASISVIERQTIFYLYEGAEKSKWDEKRPHSANARRLRIGALKSFTGKNYPITYDHCIPLATLRDGLAESIVDENSLRQYLAKYIQGVVITKDEDGLLRKHKLSKSMPVGSDPHDMTARYRAAGIALDPEDEVLLSTRI